MNTFEITSGAVRATDPSYAMDTWCADTIDNVLNGTWHVETTTGEENRIAFLTVRHESAFNLPVSRIDEELKDTFGVDSGQFGFFDNTRYAAEVGDEYLEKDSFYKEICNTTLPKGDNFQTDFTFRNYGAVCLSGWGDGAYPVFVARDPEGRIIAMEVQFMFDEEEDDEEEAA